jgi:hypothetical protein
MAKRRALKPEAVTVRDEVQAEIVRANVLNREAVRSPSFVSLYSNDTQIQMTPWDVRLIFGEIEDVKVEGPAIKIRLTGEVRMSPQHAKRVAMILIQQLRGYEETIGPIPLPKD